MKIQTKLYDDKVILQFDDVKHIYTVNNKVVYGTTSILQVLAKPALIFWAVNQAIESLEKSWQAGIVYDEIQISEHLNNAKMAHRKRLSKAADIGTKIHQWIQDYIELRLAKKPAPKMPVNKEMQKAIKGFFNWAKKHKVQLIASEQKIYSKKYKYAGTYDLEAMVDGKRTIIDFKTSKAIYPEMFLQASAYLQAKEEETGKKFDGGVAILRLSKATEDIEPFEVQQVGYEQVQKLIKVFVACLKIYEWKMEEKKQNNKINT